MKLVAVTGCPTGIAHSQMASSRSSSSRTFSVPEEPCTSTFISSSESLTASSRLSAADAAIVASDISVPTERFEEMPSVHTEVQAAVTDAEALIEKAKEAVENGENRVEYKSSTNSMGIMKKIKELLP